MSDNPYQLVEDNPERYFINANGVIQDKTNGRFVAAPGGGENAITPARSSDMHKLAAEKRIKAELAAGAGLGRITLSGSELAAWSDIVENQGRLALDTKKGQTSTKAAEFVGKAAGFLSDRRSSGDNSTTNNTLNLVGDAFIDRLVDIIREREGPNRE